MVTRLSVGDEGGFAPDLKNAEEVSGLPDAGSEGSRL